MSDSNEKNANGVPSNAVPMTKEELTSISSKTAILSLGISQLKETLSEIDSPEKAGMAIESLVMAYEMQNRFVMRLVAGHVIALGINIEDLRAGVMLEGKKFGEAVKDYEAAMKAASAAGPSGNGTVH